jgi:hypothetical protein
MPSPPGGGRMPQGNPVRPGPALEGGFQVGWNHSSQDDEARRQARENPNPNPFFARRRQDQAQRDAQAQAQRDAEAAGNAAMQHAIANATQYHAPGLDWIKNAPGARGGEKKRKASEWSELVKEVYWQMKKENPNVTIAQAAQAASKRRKGDTQKKS